MRGLQLFGLTITLRGVAVGVASGVLLSAGMLFGYVELMVVGVAGLVALCAALIAGVRPWRLEVVRQVDHVRVVAGEPCRPHVSIRHRGRWLGVNLVVTDWCDRPSGPIAVPVPVMRLKPGERSQVHYDLPTARRGVLGLGPLEAERADIFALVKTRRRFADRHTVWVHPRAVTVRNVPTGARRSLDGELDKVEHGNITFHSLREYVVGDDLRQVHWRTSAHVGTLMVRENVDTSVPRMVVLVDDRASAYTDPEKFEVVARAAASVSIATLASGLALELHAVAGPSGQGRSVASAQTAEARDAFLDFLTEAELQEKGSMRAAGLRLRHVRDGDTLVVLTGSSGAQETGAAVAGLRDRFPSIVVVSMGETSGVTSQSGMLMVAAETVDDFVRVWEGVQSW